jgi:hypothetical protein
VAFLFGEQMHIMIAMPAYTGVVHMGTMRCLFTDLTTLIKRGDTYTFVDDIGNALIADSRSITATKFFEESDCDQLIFIDNDVSWEAGALLKLIDAPEDVVAGIYPRRKDPIEYAVHYLEKEELWANPETGLLEVKAVPTGFMKISRNCIAKLIEAFPESHRYEADSEKRFYPLFDHIFEDDYKWGEDYSFCIRWRKIGGKVWIDPEMHMGHTGHKMFQGHLGNWLKNR